MKYEIATQTLAEFVMNTNFDDIPRPVIKVAKELVLDSLACMIGAGKFSPARVVTKIFEELQGVEESTIWSSGKKAPCLHATYVNAYLANLLDYDDNYIGVGHPGATIVPPALAVAERTGASGQDFLTAVVLGYEVSIRIALAMEPTPEKYCKDRGWG